MAAEQLTKDDLLNMMESYKSNIEFNKQLFSSQEKIINDHGRMIDNLGDIAKSQERIMIKFEYLTDKLVEHNTTCTSNSSKTGTVITAVNENVTEGRTEALKGNANLKGHLIIMYGTLSGMVVSLIALAYTLISRP